MSHITLSVSGGRLVDVDELVRAIEAHMDPALTRAGLEMLAAGQAATPVVTGNLRRSWASESPIWQGRVRRVRVGPGAVYARRVNTVGRSAGYVGKGAQAGRPRAMQELQRGVASLTKALWVK